MTKTSILNNEGKKIEDVTLAKEVFAITPNDVAFYNAIVLARAAQRQGSHRVKDRSEVSGGGRKPWRQKGTGNARQGSIRAPQWYHGGVVFGPTLERNYTKSQNKKESLLALKTALTYKALDNEIIVLDDFALKTNKTKEALAIFKALKINKNVLLVVKDLNDNLILATNNIPFVTLLTAGEINTLDVARADNMVITKEALKAMEEVLK